MANLKDIAAGTLIGFSGNKTVDKAKLDTATNRVDICKTKELYFNGERLGLTDTEEEYLKKKLTEEYNARVSVAASVNKSVIEKGVQNDVTLTVVTKFDGAIVTPDSITVKMNNSTAVTMTKQTDNIYTGTVKCTDTTYFSVSVTYSGVTKSTSANVSAFYKFYFGQTTADTVTSLPSSGFTAKGPQASAAGTYPFTFTAGQYAYFLLPAGVNRGKLTTAGADGLYHAVEGVSDVPFIKQGTQATINSVAYDVFRLANAQAVSSHSITI